MKKYVTTNIRLTEQEYQTLKSRSARDRKSLASLVRDAVRQAYGTSVPQAATEEEWRNAPFWKLIGMAEGTPDFVCEGHDEIYNDTEGGLKPHGA